MWKWLWFSVYTTSGRDMGGEEEGVSDVESAGDCITKCTMSMVFK